ncbi:MAG: hypothetical protein LUG46_03415 [Erysipelotrichaceae bacterium]|nr:hypothetical protein [Erysipelotrichaceae bacterium]
MEHIIAYKYLQHHRKKKGKKDYEKLLNNVTKVMLTSALALSLFGLVGCSSNTDSDDTTETTTNYVIEDYDSVYTNMPEATREGDEITAEEAQEKIADAYTALLETGYFIEKTGTDFGEYYYDVPSDGSIGLLDASFYGVDISARSSRILSLISNDTQAYALSAEIIRHDDYTIEYDEPVAEAEDASSAFVSPFVSTIYAFYIYGDDETFSVENSENYEIVNIFTNDDTDMTFSVYLYNGIIVQIDFLYDDNADGEITLDTTYKIYNAGYKTADDFDFDTYKETYSSYIGLTYDEVIEKIASEG